MENNQEKNQRVFGLDIMRAVAIILVVLSHGIILLPRKVFTFFSSNWPGVDGVSIFFVLSGFLIGGILLKLIVRQEWNFKNLFNFWIRRWFRTLPNYFLVLFFLAIKHHSVNESFPEKFGQYLFFLQNWVSPHPIFFPEAWSLCVEEWFYLLFPVLCFVIFKLVKDKKTAVLYSALVFLIGPLLMRWASFSLGIGAEDWDANYRKVVVYRLDGLMYGVIGAYLYFFYNELWNKYKKTCLTVGSISLVVLSVYSHVFTSVGFNAVWQYGFESLTVLLFLPFLSEWKICKYRWLVKVVTFISVISYSMYLVNLTIVRQWLLPQIFGPNTLIGSATDGLAYLKFFIFWILTICLSFLIYRLFEKPIMNLRDKIKIN
ncbi:MAG TPA: acyltransferase [Candidatus Magasanikbacteria bacterium]|nr:acyltransferase [Candidatus Magasanikbacteria bacterium]